MYEDNTNRSTGMSELDSKRLIIGKCNCMTKTPAPEHHDESCPVRLVARIDKLETQLANKTDLVEHHSKESDYWKSRYESEKRIQGKVNLARGFAPSHRSRR